MIAEKTDTKQTFLEGMKPSSGFAPEVVNDALAAIRDLHFPASKDEYWKYTRPTKIVNSTFVLAETDQHIDINPYKIPGLDAWRIILVNGVFRKDLSELEGIPAGLEIIGLEDAANSPVAAAHLGKIARHDQIFTAINTAYATGGVILIAGEKVRNDKPIHIIHLQSADNGISQPRVLIVAKKNSELNVIHSFKSTVSTRTFTNSVVEIEVEQNARLDYNKVQIENEESLILSTEQVHQERDSYFAINTITLNGSWVRNNLNIVIDGENCETHLNGIYPLSAHQHVDNHTLVDHRLPHSVSHELYKGILTDNSTGIFNGKVFVRKDAQKTNAFQQNANILLSENAQVNTKPELEIYADDVKCSHGCTTGQFDEEAIFYLRSRGISEKGAKNMLVYAFAGEVLDKIRVEPLKNHVSQIMAERFNWEH
ncbi:MAG: Fe-S cluster assembly protein SufD [Bacteroidota bacterium]